MHPLHTYHNSRPTELNTGIKPNTELQKFRSFDVAFPRYFDDLPTKNCGRPENEQTAKKTSEGRNVLIL